MGIPARISPTCTFRAFATTGQPGVSGPRKLYEKGQPFNSPFYGHQTLGKRWENDDQPVDGIGEKTHMFRQTHVKSPPRLHGWWFQPL